MKTKVVYILTMGRHGYRYFEMLLLSILSLKRHNPGVRTEVVTDPASQAQLGERAGAFPPDVRLRVVEVPQEWDEYKSRYLKTKLRLLVEGDYLFVDVDTLVAGSLEAIDRIKADIAAVPDGNGPLGLWNRSEAVLCQRAGVPSPMGMPYFNSGVMYVKDTPAAYIFFEQWHRLWKASAPKVRGRDQMSLLAANDRLGRPLRELPGEWNCQIYHSPSIHYFRKAKILHYYLCGFIEGFVLPHMKGGILDDEAQALAAAPLQKGFRFYFQGHIRLSLPWSHVLHLSRKSIPLFLYLKSLTVRIASLWS